MSYMALYRKWRPKTFDEVIGQQHIIKTLKNQIKAERIGHAYLFCGTRGTGKTSTAKLFAKAVNCMNPVDGEPCDECEICKLNNSNQSMNIIEIDAASNNSVDNIREIREEVKYTPAKGKYKVYIIDEVHMLSVGAFNALLKTLEEPPAHIIFILATTEPHKILATILSRCQRYDFKRIPVEEIAKGMTKIMGYENINVDEKAIRYIARIADGAMRDAFSILDQCISFFLGQEITLDKVLNILGAVDIGVFFKMTDALHQKDAMKCIQIIDEIMVQGRDLSQFVLDLIVHLRNVLILQSTEDASVVDMSEDNIKLLKQQSEQIQTSTLTNYINIFSQLESQMKYSSQKKVLFEVAVIKLCQPQMQQSYESLIDRMTLMEEQIKKGIKISAVQNNQQQVQKKKVQAKPKVMPKAVSKEIQELIKKWPSIKNSIISNDPTMIVTLDEVTANYLDGEILYLVCNDKIKRDLLLKDNQTRLKDIIQAIESVEEKQYNIKAVTIQEYNQKYSELYGESLEGLSNIEDDDAIVESNIQDVITKVNYDNIEVE